MSSDVTTAIIAAASAIGGGVIVAGSNYLISRVQAGDAHKVELRRALQSMHRVIGLIDYRARTEPQPGRVTKKLNEQVAARAPLFDFAVARIHRRLLDPQLNTLVDQLADATAATILIAPLELLPALGEVSGLMETFAAGDEEWLRKWGAARGRLVVESRKALGENMGERQSGGPRAS